LTKKPGASFAGKIDCSMTSRGGTMTLTPTIRLGSCGRRGSIGRRHCQESFGQESSGQEGAEGQSQGTGGQGKAQGQAKEMMQGGDAFVTFAV